MRRFVLESPVGWRVPLDNCLPIHSALKQICAFLLGKCLCIFFKLLLKCARAHTHTLSLLLAYLVFSFATLDA